MLPSGLLLLVVVIALKSGDLQTQACEYEAHSYGYYDPGIDYDSRSWVVVGGVRYTSNDYGHLGRGLLVTVIDGFSCHVQDIQLFDTYETPEDSPAFDQFIGNISENSVILISTGDAYTGALSNTSESLLHSLSGIATEFELRSSLALIAIALGNNRFEVISSDYSGLVAGPTIIRGNIEKNRFIRFKALTEGDTSTPFSDISSYAIAVVTVPGYNVCSVRCMAYSGCAGFVMDATDVTQYQCTLISSVGHDDWYMVDGTAYYVDNSIRYFNVVPSV